PAGTDASGHRRSGLDNQRPAHTVALGADLLGFVDFLLRVQECDEGHRILLRSAWSVDGGHERLNLRHVRLEVERGNVVDDGRLGYTIERVRHEYRVALGGNALADLAHRRAQAERV